MACRTCGSKGRSRNRIIDRPAKPVNDKQVLVTYNPNQKAQVRVYGPRTKTDYGLVSGGNQIMVYKSDADANPDLFRIVKRRKIKLLPEVFSIG